MAFYAQSTSTVKLGRMIEGHSTEVYMYSFMCENSCTQFFFFLNEDILLVEFVYLVFTHVPGKSYRRWLRSLLLYLCYVFQALINSLAC